MSIQISGTDVINNARKGIFQSANVGAFNPGNRPGSAATGDLIYNTSTAQLEVWNGSAWEKACGATEVAATGGNLTYDYQGNRVHIFSSPGTFSVSTGGVVEYVIVAGGGASGGGAPGYGAHTGGGGAGGVVAGYFTVSSSPGSYPITVGAGGARPTSPGGSSPGSPSSAFGNTAIGGGRGGFHFPAIQEPAQPGGSGGGGGGIANAPKLPYTPGGTGTPGQGSPGKGGEANSSAVAGAGGGASAIFITNPQPSNELNFSGGSGIVLSGWGIPPSYGDPGPNIGINGLPTDFTGFAGGGAGGTGGIPTSLPTELYTARFSGGIGGGGNGTYNKYNPLQVCQSGLVNSGGGGGGGEKRPDPTAGAGGSGIVMIRYRKTP